MTIGKKLYVNFGIILSMVVVLFIVLSPGAGSKRHFLTASSAAPASTGCPPTTFASFTVPLGATTTCTLTVPVIFILRANSGYSGCTLLFARRTISLSLFCAHTPNVPIPANNASTANNVPIRRKDTVPPGNIPGSPFRAKPWPRVTFRKNQSHSHGFGYEIKTTPGPATLPTTWREH